MEISEDEAERCLRMYAKRVGDTKGNGKKMQAMEYRQLLFELVENEGDTWKVNTILQSVIKEKTAALGFRAEVWLLARHQRHTTILPRL